MLNSIWCIRNWEWEVTTYLGGYYSKTAKFADIFQNSDLKTLRKEDPMNWKVITVAAMCSKFYGITVLLSTHDYYGLEEIEHPEIQMIALHKPREMDLIMTWDWVLELTHYWITEP